MNLVDRNWSVQRISAFAILHPLMIRPLIVEIPNYRSGTRRLLVEKSEWICLVDHMSVMPRNDVILIQRTFGDAGDEVLPDTGILTRAQRMRIFVPIVEASHHRHGPRIGGPYAEGGAGFAVHRSKVRAELLVGTVVASLVEKIKVLLGQKCHVSATSRSYPQWRTGVSPV